MDDLASKNPKISMPSIIPVQPSDGSDPRPPRTPRLLVLILVGLLALGGIGIAAYQYEFADDTEDELVSDDSGDVEEDSTDSVVDDTVSCSLPITSAPEQAMSYGVPSGWLAEVSGGTLSIMEDERNLTAAFIYTAKLEQDLSATEFLQEFGTIFRSTIEEAGGSFSLGTPSESNGLATATAQATVSEGDLTGVFTVEKIDGFVTLKVYWAPIAEFAAKEPTLQEVVGCFDRTTILTDTELTAASGGTTSAAELTPHQGSYFSYSIPSDWTMTGETDSGIDLEAPGAVAYVGYAYTTGAPGPITPREWAENRFAASGISASITSSQPLQGISADHEVEAFEFSGTFNGQAVAGKITVGIYNVPGIFQSYASPFWSIQLVEAGLWQQYKETTQAIADSIQITDIGSRKNIQLPKGNRIEDVGGSSITSGQAYRDSVSDSSSQKWADGMRGYESVESPSTGQTYDAPLNSWNASGPDGAGYYRALPDGSQEKLTQRY